MEIWSQVVTSGRQRVNIRRQCLTVLIPILHRPVPAIVEDKTQPTPYVSTLCLPDVTAHDQLILQAIIKYHRQEQPGNEANSVHCLCINFHWKKKNRMGSYLC